jgi:hypothetical protein
MFLKTFATNIQYALLSFFVRYEARNTQPWTWNVFEGVSVTKRTSTDDILRLMLLEKSDIFTPDWKLKLIYFSVFSSLMTVGVMFIVVSLLYQFSWQAASYSFLLRRGKNPKFRYRRNWNRKQYVHMSKKDCQLYLQIFIYSSNEFYLPQYEVLIPYHYTIYHARFTFFTQRALKLQQRVHPSGTQIWRASPLIKWCFTLRTFVRKITTFKFVHWLTECRTGCETHTGARKLILTWSVA